MRLRFADVWTIGDGELNATGGIACERIRNEGELADLHRQVAWACQALIEFADLANFTPSAKGLQALRNQSAAWGHRTPFRSSRRHR